MNSERIKLLEQYVEDDPNDPFNLYALALEYQKQNPAKAGKLFELLLAKHPDYLPTYYSLVISMPIKLKMTRRWKYLEEEWH